MFGVFFVFGCTAVPDNAAHDSSSEKLPPALTSSQLELCCQFHPMSFLKKESSCSKYTVLKCSTLCHALLLTCLLSLTSKPCGWSNKGSVLAGGCEHRAKCAVSWRFTALLGGGGHRSYQTARHENHCYTSLRRWRRSLLSKCADVKTSWHLRSCTICCLIISQGKLSGAPVRHVRATFPISAVSRWPLTIY